ncbi:hypothetical protein CORC01_03664 [Colletotrichum orchidophilum]|uniref:DNA mismatch repair protein S5 domain-containing protein n=1 Tax=Colletotrichum orchidophilum TaxID=1209926 RepID=A0A1G4BII3_9PEZI|nr:uncharacterized protein CORC01_03664 [Colletotrichum orchidophilum]OHF01097.1 hypothetical protein CORC01_03664 [Colletotrichum orchidophilum]
MSITQLPQATVRQLGSSVVIPSPLLLVKELVDNAIDANANNVEIRISANAIDKIQVRDNGHGITVEDYDALGRWSHTSKLRTFEELQCKGGQTLGFRGDALASVNAVSKLTITTRTSRDQVATLLVLNPRGGGVMDKKRVSGSVGTTVDVSDLFADIPVRRQEILKESKKAYTQIKELLKVADAEPMKVSGKGYFISVDARPMATTRGTMKKLVDIYQQHLRGCMIVDGSSKSISKPFIRLNIECIFGSYDPNVTTAKDEVIFANEPKLLALFEDMCKEVYQPTEPNNTAEVFTESCHGANKQTTQQSPDNLPDDDEEHYSLLQDPASGDRVTLERTHTGLLSPESGLQLPGSPDRTQLHGRISASGAAQSSRHPNFMNNDLRKAGDGPVLNSSSLLNSQQPRISRQAEENNREPDLTQTLLRIGWEVNMARDETASPEGRTQPILLYPSATGIHELIQSQKVEQAQREEPNPWSLAKKTRGQRSTRREDMTGPLFTDEHSGSNLDNTIPHQRAHVPEGAEFIQEADGVIGRGIEDPRYVRHKNSQPVWIPAATRENIYVADNFESPILQHPIAPPTTYQAPRHQDQRRIPKDDEAFHLPRTRHDIDDLEVIPERGPGVRERIGAQTPYPFANLDQSSVFGTPPPSSSPTAQEVVSQKRDGPRQSRLALKARRERQPLDLEDTANHCFPMVESRYDEFQHGLEETRTSGHHYEQASPQPNEREMLERLNVLRHRIVDEYGKVEEECGRSLSRRPTTPLPDMSPRRDLKKRLASRFRSRIKTHKRMRSEMLPFEKLFSEPHTQTRSLTLDLQDLRKQVTDASDYDLYVLRGVQELAFHMETDEMDNVSNKLQEIVGAWAYKEHGVELELEIDIGALCDGGDVKSMMG